MNPSTDNTYGKKLSSLLASLEQWNTTMLCDRMRIVSKFMEKLLQLYLEYFQYHLQDVGIYAKEYLQLLSSCIPLINDQLNEEWNEAMCHCCNDNNEWLALCYLNSTTQAFHDMFQQHVGFLNDECIVEYTCYQLGEGIAPSDIPKNIPHHHWWWFNKHLSNDPNEIIPPWIIFPRLQPNDPFWQQDGKTYFYSLWLAHWNSLSKYEQRQLLVRWPQPDNWKAS